MKKIIVSVQDMKSGYADPFTVDNESLAIRLFRVSFADSNNLIMSSYPDDFRLVKIGEYDSKTGVIDSYPESKFVILANGTDFHFADKGVDNHEVS